MVYYVRTQTICSDYGKFMKYIYKYIHNSVVFNNLVPMSNPMDSQKMFTIAGLRFYNTPEHSQKVSPQI